MRVRKFEIIEKYKEFDIILPERKTKDSAGYDISTFEQVEIKPGEIKLIDTGLKILFPKDEVCLIIPRSSLSIKRFLTMPNNVGVIDSDYYGNSNNEGHLMVPIYNFGKTTQILEKNERFCQAIFIKYGKTKETGKKRKREGGFGSSN